MAIRATYALKLSGYMPALPTPFTDDDKVDYAAFRRLCGLQIEHEVDRAAVLAVAAELDRSASACAPSGFTFFVRTSVKLCDAIIARDDPEAIATLRVHLRKIEHQTLRRAFEAVLAIEPFPKKRHTPVIRSRENLWKGLSAR